MGQPPHNRFFYGRHLSAVVAAHGGRDLPIYLRLFQGGRHDSVAGAVAFIEAEQLYPEGFSRFVGDSAFDAAAMYVYLDERGTDAVVDLNEREVDSQVPAQKTKRRPWPLPMVRAEGGKAPVQRLRGLIQAGLVGFDGKDVFAPPARRGSAEA